MFAKQSLSFLHRLIRPVVVRSLPSIASNCRNISKISQVQIARYATLPAEQVSSYSNLTPIEFERQSEHTLQFLNTFMEDLSDKFDLGTHFDVSYANGVLSVAFGSAYGTYVLNKQTPNKQIWLSSPKSGPKRFDYNPTMHSWTYRHDNSDLFDLLSKEISEIVNSPVIIRNPLLDS
ncbi:unnamed protein product [Hymenolepis diminuta]|uniref:ferroxidase n=1 Tax=Hymenolepis diminuta TaxID=6216 RepID=A0A0R3SCD1_HYMDI|nr:unnamed protein product [Hymenolepis diminuta]VUZ42327.1 unnamed protein product [Hymenolepis diminuta]